MSSASTICADCGAETYPQEYYMVSDELWRKAAPTDRPMAHKKNTCLCIGCLEGRLGQRLTTRDFTLCPLNFGNIFSPTTSDRLLIRMESLIIDDSRDTLAEGEREELVESARSRYHLLVC